MAMPMVKNIEEFLKSLTIVPPINKEEYDKIEVVPQRALKDNNNFGQSGSIYLWYRKNSEISVESILRRIQEELNSYQHFTSQEIAKIFLSLVGISSKTEGMSRTEILNKLFSLIGKTGVNQYLIMPFPHHPFVKPLRIGRFTIGPLDRNKLIYRCEKVDCDFFKRYPDHFLNRSAIEGYTIDVYVFDWSTFMSDFKPSFSPQYITISDYYFETISSYLRDQFYQEFWESQELLISIGAPYIDISKPSFLAGTFFITIFQKLGKRNKGYFCPQGISLAIDFASIDRCIPEFTKQLEEKYGLKFLSNSELHNVIRTFCHYLVKAKVHDAEMRIDEAFLHFIIALDLLFGEKDASTESIARRVAVIVYNKLGNNFDIQKKKIKNLYDRRSKYVHQGIKTDENLKGEVAEICEEVLFCLLRLQKEEKNHQKGFISSWLKNLDFLVSAIEAGKEQSQGVFLENGIFI